MSARDAGKRGEEMARGWLEARGLRTLARNYRYGRYEIDLVMEDGPCIVFVEVKARSGHGAILGREAVNRNKQRHIIVAAQGYLQRHGAFERPARFDVAEVDLISGAVVHIPHAFTL